MADAKKYPVTHPDGTILGVLSVPEGTDPADIIKSVSKVYADYEKRLPKAEPPPPVLPKEPAMVKCAVCGDAVARTDLKEHMQPHREAMDALERTAQAK